jgi:hypothetical protein
MQFLSATIGFLLASVITLGASAPCLAGFGHTVSTVLGG